MNAVDTSVVQLEEEGISEDEYFEADTIDGSVMKKYVIKPGFLASVQVRRTCLLQIQSLIRIILNNFKPVLKYLVAVTFKYRWGIYLYIPSLPIQRGGCEERNFL